MTALLLLAGPGLAAELRTVTFDPAQTTPEALATAVSQAGFPAKVLHNDG